MEEWYKKIRDMKTESEIPYNTERLTNKIFHDLSRIRIRDKGKFKNRMGPEFENWVANLSTQFDADLLNVVIGDDDFWNLTLKLTLGV